MQSSRMAIAILMAVCVAAFTLWTFQHSAAREDSAREVLSELFAAEVSYQMVFGSVGDIAALEKSGLLAPNYEARLASRKVKLLNPPQQGSAVFSCTVSIEGHSYTMDDSGLLRQP